MTAKIELKTAEFSIELEGEEDFIRDQIGQLESLIKLLRGSWASDSNDSIIEPSVTQASSDVSDPEPTVGEAIEASRPLTAASETRREVPDDPNASTFSLQRPAALNQ